MVTLLQCQRALSCVRFFPLPRYPASVRTCFSRRAEAGPKASGRDVGGRSLQMACQPPGIGADMQFHPEMPPVPLPRPVHLRIAGVTLGLAKQFLHRRIAERLHAVHVQHHRQRMRLSPLAAAFRTHWRPSTGSAWRRSSARCGRARDARCDVDPMIRVLLLGQWHSLLDPGTQAGADGAS